MSRFERQILLTGFGEAAQQKLLNAKVLVVGAGGLGCPILLYLAAAGVGTIAVVDGDKVALSNLNRQVIFEENDINKSKAETAVHYLKRKHKDIQVIALPYYLNTENSIETMKQYDLIIDGTDNFETRYMVNDSCILLDKPLVFGAIYKNEGQVALFNTPDENGIKINYRDVFPIPPTSSEIPNCSETGVLGVLPGMIGIMMATEAIKWLSGYGKTLCNKMMIYGMLDYSFYELKIHPNTLNCHAPKTIEAFRKTDYKVLCGSTGNSSLADITWQKAISKKENNPHDVVLIDIRELHENPKLTRLEHIQQPLSELMDNERVLPNFKFIYLFCQTGVRSRYAAATLQKRFPDKNICSIEGGIIQLFTIEKMKEYVS